MVVQKSLFNCLRQHCERCPNFVEQSQDLSNDPVVDIPHERPPGKPSKKRKHGLGPQQLSEQPEIRLPLHPSQEPGLEFTCRSSTTSLHEPPAGAPAKGPCERRRLKPRKNRAADWFIQHAPKATEWRKRQTELKLDTAQQYEDVIRAFTDRTNAIVKTESSQGDIHT